MRLSPDSAAAKIALSYAKQANFLIREARDTLQAAVAQFGLNAYQEPEFRAATHTYSSAYSGPERRTARRSWLR